MTDINYTPFQKKIEYGIPVELRDNISQPIEHCDYIRYFLDTYDEKYGAQESC